MSTEKPRKPFGYCRHGEHWKCPIIINIIRVDGAVIQEIFRVWMPMPHRRGEIDMYVFTRDGLVAIAHYDPEMNNHEGWLEDGIRARSISLP